MSLPKRDLTRRDPKRQLLLDTVVRTVLSRDAEFKHLFAPDGPSHGGQADFLVSTEHYDAILLDLGLPRIDGLTLLERWRAGGIAVPVLVLTARGSWSEKVRGIDGGADDYLTKPFLMEELLARLRALIRRASGQLRPELRHGALVLDSRTSAVTLDGQPVKLTSHEPCHIDELIRESGLATTTLSATLTMMELKGMVKQVGGMQYVLAR